MSRPVDLVLGRLQGVRRNRTGWTAKCPAHEDRSPSLSIHEAGDGKVLAKCFAGCTIAMIAEGLGLRVADFFDAPLTGLPPSKDGPGTLVAKYDYHDANGTAVCQVRKYRDEHGEKTFRQFRPDGHGGWIAKLTDDDGHWLVERLPYRLDQIQGKEALGIAEGEKDVRTLESLGVPATCNLGGAGKWQDSDTRHVVAAGAKRVAVVQDNDPVGRKHALDVARKLYDAGLEVRLVELPNLPPKGDVTDWVRAGGTAERLKRLIRSTPVWTPEDRVKADAATSATSPAEPTTDDTRTPRRRRLTLQPLRELMDESDQPVAYLVHGLIPAGGVFLCAAKPKVGKSTLLLHLAVAVARGEPFLDRGCQQGAVWYLSFDRDPRSVVRARFTRLGVTGDEPIRLFIDAAPPDVCAQLTALAVEERPALIIIDTLQRFARVADLSDYATVTLALDPIIAIARDSGAAVGLSHHAKKGDGHDIDSILGSTAIAGSVETMILLRRHDNARLIKTIQRHGPELEETVLGFDEATGRVSMGPSRKDFDRERVEREILDVLTRTADPLSEADLFLRVEGRQTTKRDALRELQIRQAILREGDGKRGSPFLYTASVLNGSDLPSGEPPGVSRTLVPAYTRVREYEKPENDDFARKQGSDSRTRDLAISTEGGYEKQVLGTRNGDSGYEKSAPVGGGPTWEEF
jgi:hypothetical protein